MTKGAPKHFTAAEVDTPTQAFGGFPSSGLGTHLFGSFGFGRRVDATRS